jgi:integrase
MLSFAPISLGDLAKRWIDHHEHGRNSSLATVRRYRTAVQHLLNFESAAFGPRYSHELAADSFVRYLRTTQVSPNGHPNTSRRQLRENGIRFIIEACRSMFNFAASRRLVPPYYKNPFSMIANEASRHPDAKTVHVFSANQATRFLEACDSWQFVIFFTLATTGLRPGELIHLLVEDLDFENGLLRIRSRPSLGWHIKTRCDRAVPIFEEFIKLLRRMLNGRESGVVFRRKRFCDNSAPILDHVTVENLEAVARAGSPLWVRTRRGWQIHQAASVCGVTQEPFELANPCRVYEDLTADWSWHRHNAQNMATHLCDADAGRQRRSPHPAASPRAPQAGRPGAGLGMTAVYTHTRPDTYRQANSTCDRWLMPEVLALCRIILTKFNGTDPASTGRRCCDVRCIHSS